MSDLPRIGLIDYAGLLAAGPQGEFERTVAFLAEELPFCWRDAYLEMTPRRTLISRIRWATFEYIYDDLDSLEASGDVPWSPTAESRLVAVLGRSAPRARSRAREDGRLRGFIGRTEAEFGTAWDKGHFIGHELGGAVDGMEANVFIQRRDLNRGWSKEGKAYRAMERYCRAHAGCFCFSRPFYDDDTPKPSFIEFGILRSDNDLWVQLFDNRGRTLRDEARDSSELV
ncbi:MAG TPA: hypothetical protein VF017_15635 [Thermoanaerobaculia bacterium]|nr:hypothetical protein [Thermoanaerobaculia bacterium]